LSLADAKVRVIAGDYGGVSGPAQTFSPILILDVQQAAGTSIELNIPADYNCGVYMVKGEAEINGRKVKDRQLVNFGWDFNSIYVNSLSALTFLVLAGEPIEEPLATYGPFVMNTNKELIEAMEDFNNGRMGSFE
jgi:redox-sensitive bicupin YhaK (pirin superfamily)